MNNAFAEPKEKWLATTPSFPTPDKYIRGQALIGNPASTRLLLH